MAQKNKATLLAQAEQIRDETVDFANDEARVGGHLVDEVDSFVNQAETSDQGVGGNFNIAGQAKGGDNQPSYSATISFDCNNGNMQKVVLTGSVTSLAISNKVSGSSYLFILEQGGSGSYTVPTAGASFGTRTDNSVDDSGGAGTWEPADVGDKIIYTVVVGPDGDTFYSIETIGA